jgi:hypothetical protein
MMVGSATAMAAARAVAAIGPGADVEGRSVLETRGHASGVFERAGVAVEFEAPVLLKPFPTS